MTASEPTVATTFAPPSPRTGVSESAAPAPNASAAIDQRAETAHGLPLSLHAPGPRLRGAACRLPRGYLRSTLFQWALALPHWLLVPLSAS